MNDKVRDIATVRVSEPVSGKRRGRRRVPRTRTHVIEEHSSPEVAPEVLAAAQAAMKPGQRIVRVSWTEARVVNIGAHKK